MGALQPPRPGGDLADGQGRGVINVQRAAFQRLGGIDKAAEFALGHVTPADLFRGDFRGF